MEIKEAKWRKSIEMEMKEEILRWRMENGERGENGGKGLKMEIKNVKWRQSNFNGKRK